MIVLLVTLLLVVTNEVSSQENYREFFYKRNNTDEKATDSVISSVITQSKGKCAIFCEQEADIISLEYTAATGNCVCLNAAPADIALTPAVGTNIYYNPDRIPVVSPVPQLCQDKFPDGFVYDQASGVCYKTQYPQTQFLAVAICGFDGGVMMKVDTPERQALVDSIILAVPDMIIIGGELYDDDVWRWLSDDSVIVGFTPQGNDSCLAIARDLEFHDINCHTESFKILCEIILP